MSILLKGKTWSVPQDEKVNKLWYNEGIVYSQTDMQIEFKNQTFWALFID
jgi:uncharacterized lipoprotein YmbA